MEQLNMLWANTGLQQMVWGQGLMLLVGILLLYLAIVKKFEPLLLIRILKAGYTMLNRV
jgi:oxaloacetate decarboxylase beta subunit